MASPTRGKKSFSPNNGRRQHHQCLPRSKRDWDAEAREKQSNIENMPLVSRVHQDEVWAKDTHSLRKPDHQFALWRRILERWKKHTTEEQIPKTYSGTADLLRKLREGIVASNWSHGNYAFAVNVFELSAVCNLKAHDMNELWKSVRGLVDHLYSQPGVELKPAFIALDILCLTCYHRESYHARERVLAYKRAGTCEQHSYFRFACRVARCESPLEFFNHIYPDPPDPDLTFLLDSLVSPMRKKAVQHLRKAYYSVSKPWAARWLGVSAADEKEASTRIVSIIDRYSGEEGSCTEDESGVLRFSRTKAKSAASTPSSTS